MTSLITIRRGIAVLALATAGLGVMPIRAEARATRIVFARGRYCGSYSGDFRTPRVFLIGLRAGQEFTVRNTGRGQQYGITVTGPTGTLDGENTSSNTLSYYTDADGDHYVTISAVVRYTSVQFCAY